MVNVADYQITATGTSVAQCQQNYEQLLIDNGIQVTDPTVEEEPEETKTISGAITEIRSAVVEGNTIFYFSLGEGPYYAVSASDCQEAVIFNVGDQVSITYYPGQDSILKATKIE